MLRIKEISNKPKFQQIEGAFVGLNISFVAAAVAPFLRYITDVSNGEIEFCKML